MAGLGWMEEYIRSIPEDQKNQIKFEKSEGMYKFGGGEKRKGLFAVVIPCVLGGKQVKIKVEVVKAEIPLLIGNSTLKKAEAVLDVSKKTLVLMGHEIKRIEMNSGHFQI